MFTSIRSASHRVLILSCVVLLSAAFTPAASHGQTPASAAVSSFTAEDAIAQITSDGGVLTFDVSEDANRFVWGGNPELVDGRPAGATQYVTQGYIYPAGTLTESNGVLADGSPEFPDKVVGQWSCYGWWVGDAAHAGQSTPWLNTHLFNFGGAWGEAMLVSEGYSIDDLDVPLERAIVGGTGPYEGALGVQMETNLGFNATEGMNFSYEIRLTGE